MQSGLSKNNCHTALHMTTTAWGKKINKTFFLIIPHMTDCSQEDEQENREHCLASKGAPRTDKSSIPMLRHIPDLMASTSS